MVDRILISVTVGHYDRPVRARLVIASLLYTKSKPKNVSLVEVTLKKKPLTILSEFPFFCDQGKENSD